MQNSDYLFIELSCVAYFDRIITSSFEIKVVLTFLPNSKILLDHKIINSIAF